MAIKIPRSKENDYTREMAEARRRFVQERTGAALEHVGSYSFDPGVLPGNIENFMGVAQVPIGLAGPLRINGEHAQGDFFVPLATTEGTLVASYNRGMRLLSESGGVKTTVVEQFMQRAPVFILDDALQGARLRRLGRRSTSTTIKAVAETTTRVGKLINIGQYAVGPLRYLRFNYTTGDAAGQNMTGKATLRGLRVDQEELSRRRQLHPVGQHRHRQEALARQHAADARQARRRRVRDHAATC